jgi:predicted lipoprotein with Yx(FWY)xxD motif
MNQLFTSKNISLAIRVGVPLAAAAILAAACSSGASGSPDTRAASALAGSAATTVEVHTSNGKSFLTDGSGRSLYLFASDSATKSTCSGVCAAAWPPVTATTAPTAGMGAVAGDIGTISRSGDATQVTYAGHPLYYYAGDSGSGQTNGEGVNEFGASWYLLAPSGQQITSLTASSPQSTTPSSSPSYSSGSNAGGGWA